MKTKKPTKTKKPKNVQEQLDFLISALVGVQRMNSELKNHVEELYRRLPNKKPSFLERLVG